jgi:uncharacterized protein (DUF362 family)
MGIASHMTEDRALATSKNIKIGPNFAWVLGLAVALLFTAFREEYVGIVDWRFAAVLLCGLGSMAFLALVETTGRISSLIVAVFVIELVKEALGIKYGLWEYQGKDRRFLFGVLSWVIAGVSIFTLAKWIVAPFVRILVPTKTRKLHLPILLGLAGLTFALDLPVSKVGPWFWGLYAILIFVGVWRSRRCDLAMLLALIATGWGVGNLSEYLGSQAGIWIFPGHLNYPPLYLLFGLWPIELIAQVSLSRLLAPGEVAFDQTADISLTKGWSAPWVAEEEKLEPLLKQERWAQWFFRISALVYFVVGMMFILIPDTILAWSNTLSAFLHTRLLPIPTHGEHFWTALAFSMMVTIAGICVAAQYNIRKNRNLVVLLLIAKAASSISGFALFACQNRYFAYLAIGLVDGSLFVASFIFYLLASRSFFLTQTFYLHEPPKPRAPTSKTTVVCRKDDGLGQAIVEGKDMNDARRRKFALLERVIDEAGFWSTLDKVFNESKKTQSEFRVVIKPNFMFMHAKQDVTTYTDPELVMHLVDLIQAKGFPQVRLVEAESTYGNYYENRDVRTVAANVGYDLNRYDMVDLTAEKKPYDYGPPLGMHVIGPTWENADFRVSFAKNKTHMFCNYTLTIKNVYGTLPEQNKLNEYHTKREYDWPTIETLKQFPVHFGIIDAILSADGQFGVLACNHPRTTDTIIAGENLIAVDRVGAMKMGLDPDAPGVGRFSQLASEAFGRPKEVDWVGDHSTYSPWTNVSKLLWKPLDFIEESYTLSNWWFACFSAQSSDFPPKDGVSWHIRLLRQALAPLKKKLYPYDYLGSDPRPGRNVHDCDTKTRGAG